MSPIYRPEQARLSFASEAGLGGYFEAASRATLSNATTINQTGGTNPGDRSVVLAGVGGLAVGDYLQFEAAGVAIRELRKIVAISGTTVYLDYPLGFPHANTVTVSEAAGAITGSSYLTFLPGVYEAIAAPDLVPELLPQYFLSTTANRNWSYLYRGKQTFSGSIANMILLNGFPLRFPIGRVATTGSTPTNATTTTAATVRGQLTVPLTVVTGYATGDFFQIDTGTNAEVRQIISIAALVVTFNYPFMIAHASGAAVNEVVSPFTHTVSETSELDSVTWHLLMRDTDETAANDLIRRFVGGMINRATISADEGGLLRCSWDDISFVDLVHNQTAHSSVTGEITKSSSVLVAPTGIGGAMPESAGVLGTPTYPTTAPYYFSRGSVSLFGITFARIRNFRLTINNNIEPRYYIRDLATERAPADLQENRREYRLEAAIGMEDSLSASATTRTLWKELILEGNYTAGLQGFDITLTFTRGTNDTITIRIPPTGITTSNTIERQSTFVVRGPHNIGADAPVQVDAELLFRSMDIAVVDAVAVYP